MKQFNRFMVDFLSEYGRFIGEKETANVLEAYQFRKAYIKNKRKDTSDYDSMFSRSEPVKLSNKDTILLKELSKNSRVNIKTLSEKTDFSVNTVVKRIKNFQKEGVIQSFRPMIDLDKLGYKYYKVFLYLNDFTPEKEKGLFGFLRNDPHTVYVTKSASKSDYEFELNVKTEKDVLNIMKRLKKNFKGLIDNYDVVHYYKEHKFTYFPLSSISTQG